MTRLCETGPSEGLFISAAGFRGVGIPDCVADARSESRRALAAWSCASVYEGPGTRPLSHENRLLIYHASLLGSFSPSLNRPLPLRNYRRTSGAAQADQGRRQGSAGGVRRGRPLLRLLVVTTRGEARARDRFGQRLQRHLDWPGAARDRRTAGHHRVRQGARAGGHGEHREGGPIDIVHVVSGDAFAEIPKLPGTFDFVFCDAWKRDYQKFFDMVFPRWTRAGCSSATTSSTSATRWRTF